MEPTFNFKKFHKFYFNFVYLAQNFKVLCIKLLHFKFDFRLLYYIIRFNHILLAIKETNIVIILAMSSIKKINFTEIIKLDWSYILVCLFIVFNFNSFK